MAINHASFELAKVHVFNIYRKASKCNGSATHAFYFGHPL